MEILTSACGILYCIWRLCVVITLIVVSVFQFLIGYKQGLIVLWDNEDSSVLQTYAASQVRFCRRRTQEKQSSQSFCDEINSSLKLTMNTGR